MKKKYLHEYTMKELLSESWYSDQLIQQMNRDREDNIKDQEADENWEDLHADFEWTEQDMETIEAGLIDDVGVDPEEPTVTEIEKILNELEPDGWSEELVKRHIIKRPKITSEELIEDIYAMTDLHVFAPQNRLNFKHF